MKNYQRLPYVAGKTIFVVGGVRCVYTGSQGPDEPTAEEQKFDFKAAEFNGRKFHDTTEYLRHGFRCLLDLGPDRFDPFRRYRTLLNTLIATDASQKPASIRYFAFEQSSPR